MMYTDFLIKIKNAQTAGKKILNARFSKINLAISQELAAAGFINKVEVKREKAEAAKRELEIHLQGQRRIKEIKFLSKPSLKRYSSAKDLPIIKGGTGLLILSTSEGIINGKKAKEKRIGGQLLAAIW